MTTSRKRPRITDMRTYIDAGLQLIPLRHYAAVDPKGRQRGKTPRDGSWQAKDYDSHAVLKGAEANGNNVGVRLPASVMVLDVDPRNFPEGRDSLAELVADTHLKLDVCPHTVTGSGGHHYWFIKPAGVSLVDSLDDYPGVEFKSLGRQVVAAGSVHPCGAHYEWDDLAPPLSEMPQLPQTLLDLIARPTRAHGDAAGLGDLTPEMLAETLEQLDPEDFQEEARWRDLMMACHHATNGEGRQEFIEWSTGDAKYQDDAWIIGRRWDSLHSTSGKGGRPITIKFLHMVVQEAGGEVARTAPEDDFDVWEDDGHHASKTSRWSFLSIEEVEALPPPRWLVHGVLVEASLAAIYGPPESCKSFLAIDLAMAVASGMDWHGRTVERGGVLYIAAEGAPGLGKRMRAWRVDRSAQERVFRLHLMRDELNLAAEGDGSVREFVRAVADELGPLSLIVIDTLNQTAAGADENSAKDMGRYIASMKRLRDTTGAAVLVVHHSGKDASKGMRGSTALLGAMDTTVEVERDSDGRSITVTVRKQKDAEREPFMRFNLEKAAESLVLRPTVMVDAAADFGGKLDPIVELARQMADERDGCCTLKELLAVIMERDKVADKTVRRRIEKAIPEGRGSAVASADGGAVWRERMGTNPRGEITIRTESGV